jgi:uncharacterized membrane protein
MRERLALLFGPFFVGNGAFHFARPDLYEQIVPPYLPAHRELVYASGVAEIASGLAVLHPRTRRAGSLMAIATLVAVFPANLYMATDHERFAQRVPGGRAALLARLPVQLLFIAWARAAGASAKR